MDVYHFQTLHAETFGAHLDGEQFAIKTTARGDVSAFYDAAPITPEGKSLLGTIPWLEGEVDEKLGCMGYLTPHLHMFGRCDMSLPMTIEPLAPNRTRINIYFLYPGSRFDEEGFADKIKVYHDFGALVLDEGPLDGPGDAAQHGVAALRPRPDVEARTHRPRHRQRLSRAGVRRIKPPAYTRHRGSS